MEARLHPIVEIGPRKSYVNVKGAWNTVTLSCGHKGIVHPQWKVGDDVPCTHCVTDARLSEHTTEARANFVKAPCGCWHYMAPDPYAGTDYAGIVGQTCGCGQHGRAS